jgi:Cu+-exporting ATPase
LLDTTRRGDRPTQAHSNYECPCGCVAGLTYDKANGSEHLGQCCCGNLLWVGEGAEAVVRSHYEAGETYRIDSDSVTLPWGDAVVAVLAQPTGAAHGTHETHDHAAEMPMASVRDVVCGMTIDPRRAAGTSVYQGQTYYFCALSCKERFDAEPARYVS